MDQTISPDVIERLRTDESQEVFFKDDMVRSTERLLKDKLAEDRIDKDNFPLWVILSKSYKLTFFEESDVAIQQALFEAEVCKYLKSLPPSDHTTDLYLKIGQARMLFHANLRRALGTTNRNKINERIALLSQIRWILGSGGGGSRGPGLGNKMKKIFGFA